MTSCLESVARNASVLAYSCLSIGAKIDGFKKSRFKNEILFESNPWSLSFATKNANSGKDYSSKKCQMAEFGLSEERVGGAFMIS